MASFALHDRRIDRDRMLSALGVAVVHAALGWALLTQLGISIPQATQEALAAFDVVEAPPPPPVPPPQPPRPLPERAPEKEGAAAPPNLRSRATEATAPDTPVPIPPPLTVAPVPGPGADPTQGNADRIGPGTGAGGMGDGTGSGRWGDGAGGGGGGGQRAIPLRRNLGSIDCEDPDNRCPSATVTMRFTVGIDGRVSGCRLVRQSGDALIDREACPRAERRLAFRPARDLRGRKIAATITWEHVFEGRERVEEAD